MKCSGTVHHYTVEVTGKPIRYAGTDVDEAVSALLTINPGYGEEGYVVAEHISGDVTTYCPPESNRLENEAIAAQAHMGDYALASQGS